MKIATIAAAMLAAAGFVSSGFADLPGLPAAGTTQADGTGAAQTKTDASSDVRPGQPHKEVVMTQAGGVRGSLFGAGATAATLLGPDGQPLYGAPSVPVSFTAVPAQTPKKYKKNDIVTIIINEESDSASTGKATSDKTQAYDMAIQQFLQLALSNSGIPTVGTVNNPAKLPEIKFNYNNTASSDGSQIRQDTLSARIGAKVVDVKPNGTLVVEATKEITVDKETQVFKLSAMCSVQDIQADNTVLSTSMVDLKFNKQTTGQVKDANKRGWLNGFLDKVSPF